MLYCLDLFRRVCSRSLHALTKDASCQHRVVRTESFEPYFSWRRAVVRPSDRFGAFSGRGTPLGFKNRVEAGEACRKCVHICAHNPGTPKGLSVPESASDTGAVVVVIGEFVDVDCGVFGVFTSVVMPNAHSRDLFSQPPATSDPQVFGARVRPFQFNVSPPIESCKAHSMVGSAVDF
jgi:hypothetical protein